jgi:hypothetical protein
MIQSCAHFAGAVKRFGLSWRTWFHRQRQKMLLHRYGQRQKRCGVVDQGATGWGVAFFAQEDGKIALKSWF